MHTLVSRSEAAFIERKRRSLIADDHIFFTARLWAFLAESDLVGCDSVVHGSGLAERGRKQAANATFSKAMMLALKMRGLFSSPAQLCRIAF